MATLNSTSTNAQVFAAYDDNVSYDLDASAAKARVFIEACRIMRRRLPEMVKQGLCELTPNDLSEQESNAVAWLRTNPDAQAGNTSGGGVIHSSFEEFR